MQVFPDTDVYVISYLPGCYGSFLSLLIAEFLGIKADVDFSAHGNAHAAFPLFNQSIKGTFDENNFMNVDPIDPMKPVFISEHSSIDYQSLFIKYPRAKNLVVQIKPDDMVLMGANFYFKCKVDSFHTQTHLHSEWEQDADEIFGGAKSPFDPTVTDEMILNYIGRYKGRTVWHPFKHTSNLPSHSNIFSIGFDDVIKNRPHVLHTISRMTGMPTPISVYHTYDKYIQSQRPIWNFIGWEQK